MAKKKKSKKKSDLKIAKYKDPRSRPGLYYGTDGLIKKIINGKEVWVEKNVHPTRT
tara:strand:+ start:267 stop:434 length:168 start_codon:yes stop_codon:yes gene_type:complete